MAEGRLRCGGEDQLRRAARASLRPLRLSARDWPAITPRAANATTTAVQNRSTPATTHGSSVPGAEGTMMVTPSAVSAARIHQRRTRNPSSNAATAHMPHTKNNTSAIPPRRQTVTAGPPFAAEATSLRMTRTTTVPTTVSSEPSPGPNDPRDRGPHVDMPEEVRPRRAPTVRTAPWALLAVICGVLALARAPTAAASRGTYCWTVAIHTVRHSYPESWKVYKIGGTCQQAARVMTIYERRAQRYAREGKCGGSTCPDAPSPTGYHCRSGTGGEEATTGFLAQCVSRHARFRFYEDAGYATS